MRLNAVFVSFAILAVLATGCSDGNESNKLDGAHPTDGSVTPVPDGYGPLWPCTTPGKACNPHDSCAINPVCGADRLCRPSSLQLCDDGLTCTKDICMGMGLCNFAPTAGSCALAVRGAAATDGGVGKTEIRCFTKGEKKPDDPCKVCDPDKEKKKWTGANGGLCDDGSTCTRDDYCQAGVCKGTYYGNQCADNFGCTEDLCDGKGGCLGNKLKSDWCLINGVCHKDKSNDPAGTCNTCDVQQSQSAWTPIPTSCQIDSKCYKPGDKHPLQCAECDPAISKTSWVVKGSMCLIGGLCKKPGDKDAIACATCDPTKDRYGWTPLSNLCKIDGKCYNKADKHSGGCAECDPAVKTTAWTVKGSYCLINNVCNKPGDKDSINCSLCDPTKDKYDWSAIAGLCKISGTCYKKGDKHPGLCAECDPAAQATAWTVKTSTECLIYNVCKKSGDKDLSGCASCQPTKSKYVWSALPGLCKIDGQCYTSGQTHPKSCGKCDPAKSTTAWTPAGTGCVIKNSCYAAGAKHPAGCGSCDPTKSKTDWTVSGSTCLIGSKCYGQGSKEPGSCGSCDPTKSKTSWSKASGCLASHIWSKSFGGSLYDYPYDVAVDASGNVYITGYFYNSINFGGSTLTSKGAYDIFVASFTPGGQHRWSKAFGSNSSDYGYSVTTDPNGNVYVAGYFYYSVNFGGTTLTSKGGGDIFVASFDSSGKHRWSKNFGGTSSDYVYAITADSAGNVYLTGAFYNSANFGGGTIFSKGSNDIYVASYDSFGKYRWAKGFGSTSYEYGYGVATDGSGNVYITGYFSSSAGINFGGTTLTSNGSSDMFVASFTPAGVHRWSKSYGGTSSDYGYDIATDASGNVYVTGYFYNSINFGGGVLTSKGNGDAYVASFTPAGVHRWSKNFGNTSSDYGYGVACDPGGNVYITGYFYNSINFGGGAISSNGSGDMFAASFTSSGTHRWSRGHGSTSSDYGRKIACDGAGNAYFFGYFYYTVDFGGGPFTSKGSYDMALVKVGP